MIGKNSRVRRSFSEGGPGLQLVTRLREGDDRRDRRAVGACLQGLARLVDLVGLADHRFRVELSGFNQADEHRDVALGVDAGEIAAGLMRARWIAARPTGPAPKMTTWLPASIGTRIIAMPRPVVATHESSESSAALCLLKIGTVCSSHATISSANAPRLPLTGDPSASVAIGSSGRLTPD